MEVVLNFLRSNPSLLLFATLAGGYALGKVKVKGFSLGSTTSVLLVGIAIGSLVIDPSTNFDLGILKTVSFGLFIFGVGYKVGPDFIDGLKRGGFKFVGVAVFFGIVALVSAVGLGYLFGLDQGYVAGLLGGAMTQSAVIGTADTALKHLSGVTPSAEMNLQAEVAVAYAITYIFGTAGLIILLKLLAGVFGIDMVESANKVKKDLGRRGDEESIENFHWNNLVYPRAYSVSNDDIVGKEVGEIESSDFPEMVSIDKIQRGGDVIHEIKPDMEIKNEDTLLLLGTESALLKAGKQVGEEVEVEELREMVGEILDICVTNDDLDGKTVEHIVDNYTRGCFVRKVKRQGHEMPFERDFQVRKGDTLEVMGEKRRVENFADKVGYAERSSNVTDIVTVAGGVILGTLLGLIAVPVAGIPLTLGVGGGVLLSGLFFGWMRSLRPTWGKIPSSALWIFTDLGLNLFIACVGLSAGPKALQAFQQSGLKIFTAGVLLTTIPHLLTWFFGKYALKLNPVLLMGAMTGAGTCTAAMNSVKEDSKSTIPVIGYTVPYAVG
ncbi:MAG: aspartate:alanine exchanger family transporter, partial [Candidatus Acetothermia bacterium]